MTQSPTAASSAGQPVSRRTLVKGAAWSIPVIGAAVVAPVAMASTDRPADTVTCTASDGRIVFLREDRVDVVTEQGDGAIDVTIRQQGLPEMHYNLVAQGANRGDNQLPFTPGEVVAVRVPRRVDPKIDWFQVATVHPGDCA